MKTNIFLWSIIASMSFAFAKAQTTTRGIKVGYIDMEYILESVPEYQRASQELETKMQKWNGEIQTMKTEIEQMQKTLQNEKVLLTKELIEEKEEDIKIKQEDLLAYQQKRFGAQGDFVLQKQQLIQPVQDQVFNEVQKISNQKKYDFVMDASEVSMLYSAERHDISDEVLKAIGRAGKAKDREEKRTKGNLPASDPEADLYLSVVEAESKESQEQAKQDIVNDREADRIAKISSRDSVKAAKAQAYQLRREKLIEDRERRKDSIIEARAKARENKTPPGSN
jgi:Skp family chaperone for outer membrane proteins